MKAIVSEPSSSSATTTHLQKLAPINGGFFKKLSDKETKSVILFCP